MVASLQMEGAPTWMGASGRWELDHVMFLDMLSSVYFSASIEKPIEN
jgi:hypothetical protein